MVRVLNSFPNRDTKTEEIVLSLPRITTLTQTNSEERVIVKKTEVSGSRNRISGIYLYFWLNTKLCVIHDNLSR